MSSSNVKFFLLTPQELYGGWEVELLMRSWKLKGECVIQG